MFGQSSVWSTVYNKTCLSGQEPALSKHVFISRKKQNTDCTSLKQVPALSKSRKKNPQKLTQLSSRSHPRHLVGKRTAQKGTIIDITSVSTFNYP